MRACPECGRNISSFRRFHVNPEGGVYLPCKFCGAEQVDQDKFLRHLVCTGIVMGLAMLFEDHLPVFFNGYAKYIVGFAITVGYFYLFLPLRR